MKAAVRRKYIPLQDLRTEGIPVPECKQNEMLIKVHATTVNRTDCAIVSGKPFIMRFFIGLLSPKDIVPGTDFAGEIVAVGNQVNRFKVGDRVMGFRDEGLSSQAEFVAVPKDSAVRLIPDNITYVKAAASMEGAHYALNFINKVDFKPGQKVLINGATGAIGSSSLQFLKEKDLVITAVGNTKNLALLKSLGADRVIDYTKTDFTSEKKSYDFIFDAVGKSTFGKCKKLLKKNGVYISSELGPYSQNPFLALLTPFLGGKTVKFPIPSNIKKSLDIIIPHLKSGAFKPVIDRSYPLEAIDKAYTYVQSGQKTGNVILEIVKN